MLGEDLGFGEVAFGDEAELQFQIQCKVGQAFVLGLQAARSLGLSLSCARNPSLQTVTRKTGADLRSQGSWWAAPTSPQAMLAARIRKW